MGSLGRSAAALAFGGLLLAGTAACTGAATPDMALSYPQGCASFDLSAHRCAYIVAWAKTQAGLRADAPVTIALMGDPGCGDDPNTLCARTMAFVVRVRFTPPSGDPIDESVFCGVGGESSLLCTEHPEIRLSSPTMSGYHDVPCGGEDPSSCATPLPPIDPAAAAEAAPLRVAALDIPIAHAGDYSIPVGTAVLPNGILTVASFTLEDDSPTDVVISAGTGVFLGITSLNDGRPLWNYFDHGWHPGVEHVEATLTFTVESFEPGAVLRVRDLVVR
jgi:hypothetical protein